MFRTTHGIIWLGLVFLTTACLPSTPPYPDRPASDILAEATQRSAQLEAYIKRWLDGEVPARIPDALIPPGITDSRDFYLRHPDSMSLAETWASRPAGKVRFDSLLFGLPDPHVSYLFLATALAPFGSQLVLEGEFPHARFFSIQITPPLDGIGYYAQRVYGGAEVSLVDVDIDPLPGHINPYRPGAQRQAAQRSYRVIFDLAMGNPVMLNQTAHRWPYRGSGNRRTGALITYQGPWGRRDFLNRPIPGGGDWNLGALWLRIYAPDQDQGPWGGVAWPKAYFQLPDGRRYAITSNSTALRTRVSATAKAQSSSIAPRPYYGPGAGWGKSWGILHSMLTGACVANGWTHPDTLARVRAIDRGVTGRGPDEPAPHHYEAHATVNNYATYLGRSMAIEKGYVAVLTGRMPTFPSSRAGNQTLSPAEVRYWSLCSYSFDPLVNPGACFSGLLDEQVILHSQRRYLIVFSRAADRPRNAQAQNGVTWVDWGPTGEQGWLLRWVSVEPEWQSPFSPHEHHLPWHPTDPVDPQYNPQLLGINHRRGFMGDFLPTVHYLPKSAFEALGEQPLPDNIPVWMSNKLEVSPHRLPIAQAAANGMLKPEHAASKASDGNTQTLWASGYGAEEKMLTLDLGVVRPISAMRLLWERFAHAKQFSIEKSMDGTQWETLFTNMAGRGNLESIQLPQVTNARYLRLRVKKTSVGWCSLYEWEVFSSAFDQQP